MAKYRMVHTEFWNDPTVVEEMTPEDKYFFLYLLTNKSTTQIGVYQITKKQMSFDTGYSIESVNSLLDRFINHHKIVKYNTKTREIAVRNWGKYNLNKGGKPVIDCVKAELKEVKDTSLIEYVAERIGNPTIKNLYDSYNDTYHDTCNDSLAIRGQKEKEKEKEKEKKEKHLDHVLLYDYEYEKLITDYGKEEIDSKIEDLDTYISNKGKNPYKDHNKTIRNWLKRDNVKSIKEKDEEEKRKRPTKEDRRINRINELKGMIRLTRDYYAMTNEEYIYDEAVEELKQLE